MDYFFLPHSDLIIRYTIYAILFFLLSSLIGLFILALIKIYINLYFSTLNQRKEYWLSHLLKFLKREEEPDFSPGGTGDLIALAKAFSSLHLETHNDYARICRLIRHLDLDRKLLRRYRKTVMTFRRMFLLSTMAELPCSNIQSFYLEILRSQNDPLLMHHALFAYSKTVTGPEDMENFIRFLMKFDEISHVGRSYCKFLIFIALKRLTYPEMERFLIWLEKERPETRIIRCIADSMGRLHDPSMEKYLLWIYNSFSESGEIVAGVLRSLVKCRLKNCQIVKEICLRKEFPIRIACAKVGMDLCYSPDKILDDMIIYFFDENYYVRQNIYEACLRHHIPKKNIISTIRQKMPEKKKDPFFNDMMDAYTFVR